MNDYARRRGLMVLLLVGGNIFVAGAVFGYLLAARWSTT